VLARTLLSLLNLAAVTVALVAWFALPQYAVYELFGFVGWMIVGFVLLGSSWGSRPIGSGVRGAGGAPARGGGPLASSGAVAGGTTPELGFCAYCATNLAPGAGHCPACHRAVLPL
jgi:hypothetical protein